MNGHKTFYIVFEDEWQNEESVVVHAYNEHLARKSLGEFRILQVVEIPAEEDPGIYDFEAGEVSW